MSIKAHAHSKRGALSCLVDVNNPSPEEILPCPLHRSTPHWQLTEQVFELHPDCSLAPPVLASFQQNARHGILSPFLPLSCRDSTRRVGFCRRPGSRARGLPRLAA